MTKQDVFFFGPPAGDGRFAAEWTPCLVDYDAAMYGIPAIQGRGLKVGAGPLWAGVRPLHGATGSSTRSRPASPALYVESRFPDLAGQPIVETRVCQYETTPDTNFVIDRHPDFDNVWLVGGGSGPRLQARPGHRRVRPAAHRRRAARRGRGALRPRPAAHLTDGGAVGRRLDRLALAGLLNGGIGTAGSQRLDRRHAVEFSDVVRKRRMVRHFSDEAVDRAVLERIAETAQRAPSAGFSQGQRLLVVTDPEHAPAARDPVRRGRVCRGRLDRWISQCAALFIPCVSEEVYHARYREADKVDDEATRSTGRSPTGGWTSAARSCSSSSPRSTRAWPRASPAPTAMATSTMRELLGIPADCSPVGVIPVGHPLPDMRSPSLKRGWRPNAEFARWGHW